MLKLKIPQRYLILFLILIHSVAVYPLDLKFEKVSLEEGLSHSTVLSIYQDQKGFMWFGTNNGLNRYNGYKIDIFRNDPAKPDSVPENQIFKITGDFSGNLWLRSVNKSLIRYEVNIGKFSEPKVLSNLRVNTTFVDQMGDLWLGNEDGISIYRVNSSEITQINFPSDGKEKSKNVQTLYQDSSRKMWVGSGKGLFVYDHNNNHFKSFADHTLYPSAMGESEITTIHEDHNGSIWIGTTDKGLFRYDPIKDRFSNYSKQSGESGSLNSDKIQVIFEDSKENLWIGTNRGLNLFNPVQNSFTNSQNTIEFIDYIAVSGDMDIQSIFEDRSGNLWVGSLRGGVHKLSFPLFPHFNNRKGKYKQLPHNRIWSFAEDQEKNIWIGTQKGLVFMNREKEVFQPFDKSQAISHPILIDPVWSLATDQEGKIWAGLENKLFVINQKDKGHNFKEVKLPGESGRILALYPDENSLIWIGTENQGLILLNQSTGKIRHYSHSISQPNRLSHSTVKSIYKDREGILWIGTLGGGLNRLDLDTGRIGHYRYQANQNTSLSDNYIYSIYEDSLKGLWIATSRGLNQLNRHKQEFTRYTQKEGLVNNIVYGILEDEQKRLWLSTNNGLSRYSLLHGQFKNYSYRDGLQDNEFTPGAFLKTTSNEMAFGGINGFNLFKKSSPSKKLYEPPVVLTDFKVMNQSIKRDRPFHELNEIILSYKEKIFSFSFAALDYTRPKYNQYAYKLIGFDQEWIYSGVRNYASYTNLEPGAYLLRIKGANQDGVWNADGVSLKIRVEPPLWQTWWGYSLLIIVLGVFYLSVRQR
ncbi:MAG: hypothetical protein GY786_22340 [Proteobacteria bacterium]|nr:hypothetical protein [Pseudomonadota bacterium]